ncbi:MAG: 3'-5' exonuclease [Acholeplasmataceae bacterium]|nr:MAG: 3'-5' exonuclease [Acholeplasmataceae bacterium]
MNRHDKILVFDFETTGLHPQFDQIIEIGAIVLSKKDNGFEEVDHLNILVQVGHPLPLKITQITGITDAMLRTDGVSPESAFQQLFNLYDAHTLLVAYNLQFDLSFLHAFIRRYWQPQFEIKNDILDVMAVYRDRHPYPHRLESAVQTYQVDVKNTHRGIDDVRATYAVLKAMQAEQDNIDAYVNVIGYNPKYAVSGLRLPHVRYVPQRGGMREIEKS